VDSIKCFRKERITNLTLERQIKILTYKKQRYNEVVEENNRKVSSPKRLEGRWNLRFY